MRVSLAGGDFALVTTTGPGVASVALVRRAPPARMPLPGGGDAAAVVSEYRTTDETAVTLQLSTPFVAPSREWAFVTVRAEHVAGRVEIADEPPKGRGTSFAVLFVEPTGLCLALRESWGFEAVRVVDGSASGSGPRLLGTCGTSRTDEFVWSAEHLSFERGAHEPVRCPVTFTSGLGQISHPCAPDAY